MRFLVLQHHPEEHPGVFRDFLAADGIAWDAVELDAGETIPTLDGYDALWVMGGPMDVWQEAAHPWLVTEKAVIRQAVAERDLPFLGVCLGHQLLAEAMGGKVEPMAQAEIGVLPVEFEPAGRSDPLLANGTGTFPVLQWHGAEVTRLPPGGVSLARSTVSLNQAIRVGTKAYGIQFHMEVSPATVPAWAEIPEYWAALESSLGGDALPAFERAVADNMAAFNASARRLYDGFMTLLR